MGMITKTWDDSTVDVDEDLLEMTKEFIRIYGVASTDVERELMRKYGISLDMATKLTVIASREMHLALELNPKIEKMDFKIK